MDAEPGGDERVGVLDPVLLVVHDNEVGRQRDDRLDVGILGPADHGQVGSLAEPRARHRIHVEGAQRLGDGRDE